MATQYEDRGIPFLRSKNVEYLRLNLTDVKYIGPEFHRRLRKSRLQPGDVVIVRTGAPGTCAVIPDSLKEANCSDLVIVRCGPHLDPNFLAYYINSSAKHYVNAHLVGAVQQHFNVGSARTIRLRLPSIEEQRAIVAVLGAIDDKIELNRKMSATLEAIVRAVFKSWFVDFDPVRAKAESRNPGLPAEIAALFPNSFEETAHGQVPCGWRVGDLGDLISQRVDRCDESEETASKPYVPIDCIGSKSLLLDAVKPGYDAKSSLTRFYKDDILFGAMRPYFHKVCVAPFDGITRTTVFTLYPRERADFAFATLLLHDDRTIDYATAHSTGTTIPYAVWRNSLERMQAVIPPPRLRETFGELVGPALQRIAEVFSESQTLSQLLNTLLPKLISGELRVGEAERVLAASA